MTSVFNGVFRFSGLFASVLGVGAVAIPLTHTMDYVSVPHQSGLRSAAKNTSSFKALSSNDSAPKVLPRSMVVSRLQVALSQHHAPTVSSYPSHHVTHRDLAAHTATSRTVKPHLVAHASAAHPASVPVLTSTVAASATHHSATAPSVKTTAAKTSSTSSIQAVWLWNTGAALSAPHAAVDFCLQHGINLIYLQINYGYSAHAYSALIGQAHAHGIQVDALSGNPGWGLSSGQASLTAFINWVGNYNLGASGSQRFSGINLDIEPYVLSQWTSSQSSVVQQWQANVDQAVREGAKFGLPVTATVPFWLDTVSGGSMPLGKWMIRTLSQVDIMAYRSQVSGSNGVMAVASQELQDAKSLGKSAVVAVDLTNSGSTTSFYSQGPTVMAHELTQMSHALSGNSAYAGWAVNDYSQWVAMAGQ